MDLIPICIFVTPKSRPPRRIKLIQCSVLVFQPLPKLFLTFFTMTCGIFEVSSELIGNMPEDHIFFLSESLRKSPVYLLYLPPHDRRGIAEVMALPRQVYRTVRLHLKRLGILLCKPVRHSSRRSRQNYLYLPLSEFIYNFLQPFKRINVLLRL